MKRITILIVGLMAMLTLSAGAATIHVPADQPTIQAGINAAVDGDTVLVAPGVYLETSDSKASELSSKVRANRSQLRYQPPIARHR
jgi:hypothetical protein